MADSELDSDDEAFFDRAMANLPEETRNEVLALLIASDYDDQNFMAQLQKRPDLMFAFMEAISASEEDEDDLDDDDLEADDDDDDDDDDDVDDDDDDDDQQDDQEDGVDDDEEGEMDRALRKLDSADREAVIRMILESNGDGMKFNLALLGQPELASRFMTAVHETSLDSEADDESDGESGIPGIAMAQIMTQLAPEDRVQILELFQTTDVSTGEEFYNELEKRSDLFDKFQTAMEAAGLSPDE